jgi:hypothetical protein
MIPGHPNNANLCCAYKCETVAGRRLFCPHHARICPRDMQLALSSAKGETRIALLEGCIATVAQAEGHSWPPPYVPHLEDAAKDLNRVHSLPSASRWAGAAGRGFFARLRERFSAPRQQPPGASKA